MNLILLFEEDFTSPGRVRLSGRRLKHVRDVLRPAQGEQLTVGLCNSRMGRATIMYLAEDALELDVVLDKEPPPALPVTLVLGLPRPKALRRVLRTVTALGVKRIILLNSARVEKSFWQTPFLQPSEINRQLILGLEQAKDTVMPEVLLRPRFKPFVEDELPALAAPGSAFVAHPTASNILPGMARGANTLAVGPEGGFVPYEIDLFAACGFIPVCLGQRILPVEAAVPALIGRVCLGLG